MTPFSRRSFLTGLLGALSGAVGAKAVSPPPSPYGASAVPVAQLPPGETDCFTVSYPDVICQEPCETEQETGYSCSVSSDSCMVAALPATTCYHSDDGVSSWYSDSAGG